MPDWPIHIIVPFLALMIVSKKEYTKYVFLFIPFAILPDLDGFSYLHRALLHNIFIPLIFLFLAFIIKTKKAQLIISSIYLTSHVFLDMFSGGVVLFYPLFDKMVYVDAALKINETHKISWVFDYGLKDYTSIWELAYGHLSTSIGTGSLLIVLFSIIYILYKRDYPWERI